MLRAAPQPGHAPGRAGRSLNDRFLRPTAAGSILPLRASGLRFEAGGRRLIDDISFVLAEGSRTLILGPNGAGKSLLLRLCHGLLAPTAGSITWGGLNPRQAGARVAMVFQKPVLLRRSAAANVSYALALHGVGRVERRARAAEVLARTGLSHLARRSARVLSGGEQQRLAIARAWALQPQVLILDEPTTHLDPAAVHRVENLVQEIHAAGATILMTSHDLGQARRLANEVMFVHRGRLLEYSAAGDFFDRPGSRAAAAYLKGDLVL